jgi:hypothetical protein
VKVRESCACGSSVKVDGDPMGLADSSTGGATTTPCDRRAPAVHQQADALVEQPAERHPVGFAVQP